MLKLLDKIASGATQYTPEELPHMVRYFRYFAEKQQPEVLAQIWPHIPQDERRQALNSAIDGTYYHIHENPDRGSLKYLLEKGEELNDPEFWQELFAPGDVDEMFGYIVGSGSEECIDLLIEYAKRYGSQEAMGDMLSAAGSGFQHIHIIDKMIRLSQGIGGEDSIKRLIDFSTLSVERIIDGRLAPPKDEKAKIETALYLLGQQYTLGGVAVVVESFGQIFENATEEDFRDNEAIYLAITQGFMDIGGNELVNAVFSHEQFGFVRYIASCINGQKLAEKIDDLAAQTQNQALVEGVRNARENASFITRSYSNTIDELVTLIRSGEINAQEIDEVDGTITDFSAKAFAFLAKKYGFKVSVAENSTGEIPAIRELLSHGTLEDVLKLAELHEALDKPNLMESAVQNFDAALHGAENHRTIEYIVDYATKHHGTQSAQALLTQPIKAFKSDHLFEPLTFVVVNRDLEQAAKFIELAEKIGGQDFVDRLILGADNTCNILKICQQAQQVEIGLYFLDRISPEARETAYAAASPNWKRFAEKTLSKRAFYQSYAGGELRWQAMTGADAPHDDLRQFSPYRFKPSIYRRILPAMQVVSKVEGNQSAVINAYKLATLFTSEQEIDQYLQAFAQHWRPDSKHVVHDACLFDLPERGRWDGNNWKNMVLGYGPEALPLIQSAPRIEAALGDIPFPSALPEIMAALSFHKFERKEENPLLAAMCGHYGFLEDDFNEMLDFLQQHGKETDYLPDIKIDGDKIGHPGFYLERLAPNDPTGFVLGQIEKNSCQHYKGNGHDCVLYGMSSPYSGFYVWRKKVGADDKLSPNDPDTIVAHSWVWIGSDNMLVYDSTERTKAVYNELVQPFLEQLAFEVVGKHSFEDETGKKTIAGVRLGCDPSGQTPPLALPKTITPSQPINYEGKYDDGTDGKDSSRQYIISPIDHASNPQPKLPDTDIPEEIERMALCYIEQTQMKLREQYGIELELMMELGFYGVNQENAMILFIDQHEKMKKDITAMGATHPVPFTVWSDDGQFIMNAGVGNPLEVIREATTTRKFLQENAKKYGYGAFIFWPRPFKSKEWSAADISIVLTPAEGKELSLNGFPTIADMSNHMAGYVSSFMHHAALTYAQQNMDFARFWNSARAPEAMRTDLIRSPKLRDNKAGIQIEYMETERGYMETTKNDVSFHYNLASSSCNIAVAVAGMLASIEYGIDCALGAQVGGFGHNSAGQEEATENGLTLPKSRHEALNAMKRAEQLGLFSANATRMLKAVIDLHDPHAPHRIDRRRTTAVSTLDD